MSLHWQPTASLSVLQARARLNHLIRAFFLENGVLEVETPLLCHSSATDPHLQSWQVPNPGDKNTNLYLQTSPEFGMKRLLASGCGPIYQLGKAFRQDPLTHQHNPEFTLLEWYRPGWNLRQLMTEAEALIQRIMQAFGQPLPPFQQLSYEAAFQQQIGINPHTADQPTLLAYAEQHLNGQFDSLDRNGLLDLLMSHIVEPALPASGAVISEFPASQAALAARTQSKQGHTVAQRAEIYIEGMELANGYQELTDPVEQQQRFQADLQYRAQNGLPPLPFPEHLMAAIAHGLPSSAGIALGVDRLLMLVTGSQRLAETLSFTTDNA